MNARGRNEREIAAVSKCYAFVMLAQIIAPPRPNPGPVPWPPEPDTGPWPVVLGLLAGSLLSVVGWLVFRWSHTRRVVSSTPLPSNAPEWLDSSAAAVWSRRLCAALARTLGPRAFSLTTEELECDPDTLALLSKTDRVLLLRVLHAADQTRFSRDRVMAPDWPSEDTLTALESRLARVGVTPHRQDGEPIDPR